MGRPRKLFPLSPDTVMATIPSLAPAPDAVDVVFDPTYTFRLRRHKTGNFPGLWELALMAPDGSRVAKIMSDADALNFCIDNLMGELEDNGF